MPIHRFSDRPFMVYKAQAMSTLRKTFLSRFLGQHLLWGLILSLYFGLSITSLHARPLLAALTPTETIGSNEILKPPKPIKTKHPPKLTDTPTATLAAPTPTD